MAMKKELFLCVVSLMKRFGITPNQMIECLKNMPPSPSDVREKLTKIVVQKLELSNDEISDEAYLVPDLGMTSLDFMAIIMETEREFSITISEEEAEKINTFGDLVALVQKSKKV